MESDSEQQHHRATNSGFSRYQSAPSLYFSSLIDRKFCEQFVNRPSSPETERIFTRFMTSGRAAEADRKTLTAKSEATDVIQASGMHQNQWKRKPPLPNKFINSRMEMNGRNCSLVRHTSSPAQLLSQINVQTGFSFDGAMLLEDVKMLFENHQYMDAGKQGSVFARHLSLPYSKSDALLHLSHSVPCKIRANRGCATHPRSIAERVRRTRISERIRKLQELVPNMDKQANTSEMLDWAIEYIKGLQKQVQTLSSYHKNCRCSKQQLRQY